MFGSRNECSSAQISEGKHDVEVFVHVPVVKKMMTVQAPEEPRPLQATRFRKMHAPVDVFVHAVVNTGDARRGSGDLPAVQQVGKRKGRQRSENN